VIRTLASIAGGLMRGRRRLLGPPAAAYSSHSIGFGSTSPGQIEHVQLPLDSFARLLGRDLVPRDASPVEQARHLFESAFVVVSHGTEADPVLNYANATALRLWEMD